MNGLLLNRNYLKFCMILIVHINSCFSFEVADLENILFNIRQNKEMTAKQSETLISLYKIYSRNPKSLSVLEDNIVFLSMEKKNKSSKKVSSEFETTWKAYKRIDQTGYSFALEDFSPDGSVHELSLMRNDDKIPYLNWHQNKLEIIYSKGIKPVRNIVSYFLEDSKTNNIIESMNDDFSPIYGPEGKSILFISDRDKMSSRDKKSAIYIVYLTNTQVIYQLSGLSLIQENINFKSKRFYVTQDKIIFHNENGKQSIFLSKLESLKKKSSKQKKKHSSMVKRIVKKHKVKNKKELLNSFIWNENELKIQEEKNKVNLYIRYEYENSFKKISDLSVSFYENRRGPFYLKTKKYFFFLSLNNDKYVMYYIYKNQKILLSDERENSFGMSYDEENNFFYYLLRRINGVFLIKFSMEKKRRVEKNKLDSALMLPGINPLEMSKTNDISYYNAAGILHLVKAPQGLMTKSRNRFQLKQVKKNKHLFSLERKKEKVNVKYLEKKLTNNEIDFKLKSFVKKIREISTIQELNQLKYEYSLLHTVVSKLSINNKNTFIIGKNLKLIRWIETLNGIKILLNKASILMEEE
ncbi:MAG: hypothetical protein COB02_09235 [Candidatus Cloacimonadota bacterium]|nr:MAG: hypothetical protein COB02_09235 [Candidatus Cloacimonadota bacterium]